MCLVKCHSWNFKTKAEKFGLPLLLALLWPLFNFGQQTIRDSLKGELAMLSSRLKSDISDTLYVNTLNDLGFAMRFHRSDSLLILSQQALDYSREIDYKEGEVDSNIGLGDYYSDHGNHEKGIFYYGAALKVAEHLKDDWLVLYAQNRLAGEYEYQGNFGEALEAMLEGIEIATRINDTKMLSIFNENIGLLYSAQNDNDEAINYLEISKRLNEQINDDLFKARTFTNMASVYADAHQYDYAMFHVNKSISIFENNGLLDWLAFAYETKGKTYLRQEKYDWALFWYNQSEMLHENGVDDERAKIDLLQGLADTHLGLQRVDTATDYASRAFESATKLKVKEGVKNAAETLYKLNKNRNDLATALAYHELFQRLSDSLARNESKKSLLMLKTRLGHERQKENLIAENETALAEQKNYLTGILGLLLVLMVITFLVKRSERIQKDLNKELSSKKTELEKSQAGLLEINETKDKLFSIIGHDLRGPIGAFQGILQLFHRGEINQKEFLSFIPKLRSDIDHISFTLNNLLSWGQTQMKGANTNPSIVQIKNLVSDNINLLSEIACKKDITLASQVSEQTFTWSDTDQVDIVIRNLISNAIKFTPKDGTVTIGAEDRNKHWEIFVRDTGVGMNEGTIATLFSKNSNITTYGTNNEKGTGLGLMLCKEMVENNNGELWVESTPKKGSCFYFTLPKVSDEFEKPPTSTVPKNRPQQSVLQ
ncbi:MAG: ATP-binding protein [Flavobacteriaceae bacterium]